MKPTSSVESNTTDAASVTRRVLVVDDDLTFVRFVCTAIENLSVVTGVALTGADALQRLAQGGWAGVLLDLKLPDIYGVEVLRRLRARGDTVPVAVLSGAATIEAAVEAMKLGAVEVLEKPVRVPALARVIEQLFMAADAGPTPPVDRHGATASLRHDSWHATEQVAKDLVAVVWAPADSPTVADWADLLRVSTPVVRTRCDLARLRPKACLYLGRIVRAHDILTQSHVPLSEIFACRDERTIATLLARGGITVIDLVDLGLRQLLTRQRFVRHEAFIEAFLKNLEQNRLQK